MAEIVPLVEDPRVKELCDKLAGGDPSEWTHTFVAIASAVFDDVWSFGRERHEGEAAELRGLCQVLLAERATD